MDDLKAKLAVQEAELKQKNENADKLIHVVGVETEKVSKEKAIADEEEVKVEVINKVGSRRGLSGAAAAQVCTPGLPRGPGRRLRGLPPRGTAPAPGGRGHVVGAGPPAQKRPVLQRNVLPKPCPSECRPQPRAAASQGAGKGRRFSDPGPAGLNPVCGLARRRPSPSMGRFGDTAPHGPGPQTCCSGAPQVSMLPAGWTPSWGSLSLPVWLLTPHAPARLWATHPASAQRPIAGRPDAVCCLSRGRQMRKLRLEDRTSK